MEPHDKLRIVVVGDSGVGKTSLVHILCHNEALRHPTWTIGCSVEVKTHNHSRTLKPYFVEFIDVGGSVKHQSSRNMFYHQINGIILVHDVSNRKSYYNLWRWIAEVLHSEAYKEGERAIGSMANVGTSNSSGILSGSGTSLVSPNNVIRKTEFDFELQIGERNASIPILVVGTKADLVKQELTGRQRRYSIVDEYGGECFNVCTLALTHFADNSIAAEKIDAFFDKVIEKKFGVLSTSGDYIQSPTLGGFSSSSSLSGSISGRDDRRRALNIVTGTPTTINNVPPTVGSPGLQSPYASNRNYGGNLHPRSETPREFTISKKQSWNGFRNLTPYPEQPIVEDNSIIRQSSNLRQYLNAAPVQQQQTPQKRTEITPIRSSNSSSNNNSNNNSYQSITPLNKPISHIVSRTPNRYARGNQSNTFFPSI
ncbi:hypothetical protein G9A89_013709 [Geosiphon pyriformis]|nr:hypothetical protein G9A89_013709 [Geosiphon pyriformis]